MTVTMVSILAKHAMTVTITRSNAVGIRRDKSKNFELIVNLGLKWIATVEPRSVPLSVDVYICINTCILLHVTRLLADEQQQDVTIDAVDLAQQQQQQQQQRMMLYRNGLEKGPI